jgi:hypothetical protein
MKYAKWLPLAGAFQEAIAEARVAARLGTA